MAESRIHRRVGADAQGEVGSEAVRVLDVSMGGMGAEVERRVADGELAVGDRVKVAFDLGEGRVETAAEIVRHGDGHVGVRFLSLDPKSLAALASHFARDGD